VDEAFGILGGGDVAGSEGLLGEGPAGIVLGSTVDEAPELRRLEVGADRLEVTDTLELDVEDASVELSGNSVVEDNPGVGDAKEFDREVLVGNNKGLELVESTKDAVDIGDDELR
jgi:hypothetical protein